jgi:hypothetical protein
VTELSFYCDNLNPFLTALGWVVDYRFDEHDYEAIFSGLRDTDAEIGRWYDYEFHGKQIVPLSVAFDEAGGSIIRLRVALPAELEPQVQLLADFCWRFHWRG